MTVPRPAFALAAVLLLLLAGAPSAGASEVSKIFNECSNGTLPTGFSPQAYTQALKQMPAELAQYGPCSDLIQKAQLAAAAAAGGHGGGGGGGAGGPGATTASVAPPTPTEQHALEHITHASFPPVHLGGEVLHPGVVHVDIASAFSTLPTPLIALLTLLLACAPLLIARVVRDRLRARRAGGPSTPD
ncbi:MAG TPA: hypothetical protein VNY52_06760 [Solirubrobacteraceae bacterium]|jgi:hypothetical protein|nr:hypothetical protein [Solirubrobacteraceae bacterium]